MNEFECRDENSRYKFVDDTVTIKYKNYHTTEWGIYRFFIKMITTPKYMESSGIIIDAMEKAGNSWDDMLRELYISSSYWTDETTPMFRQYWKMPRKANPERLHLSTEIMSELLEEEPPLDRRGMENRIEGTITEEMENALADSKSFDDFCARIQTAGKNITEHARKLEKGRHAEALERIRERG